MTLSTDKYVILFVLLVLVSLGSFVSFSRSSDVQERFEKQQKETANLLFALQDLVDRQGQHKPRRKPKPKKDSEISSPKLVTTTPTPNLADEDDFGIDHGSYDPRIQLLRNYKMLSKPSDCAPDNNLLIALKSEESHLDRREAIRQSWGNVTYYQHQTKVIFLLGRQNYEKLREEAEVFDDLLIGDFEDSFHNLTFKDSMLLTWAKNHCQSSFIFKGDDDIFINPFGLEDMVLKAEREIPKIYGGRVNGQPVVRKEGSRYADFKWTGEKYPSYVSGGGLLMNWKVAMILQRQIPQTPVIVIDDALIGIALRQAGLVDEQHIEQMQRITFFSWGFGSEKKKFDVCMIDKIVFYHKFDVDELNCFWRHFIENRGLCPAAQNTENLPRNTEKNPKTRALFCSPALWYMFNTSSVLLEGKDRGRCGKAGNNAVCTTDAKLWPKSELGVEIGPCCSIDGWCGDSIGHCQVPNVDFRTVVEDPIWEYKEDVYLSSTIKVDGQSTFQTLTPALTACLASEECSGVTRVRTQTFELRRERDFIESGEDLSPINLGSWRKRNVS